MLASLFLFVGGLGTTEVLLIVVALVLLFGAKRIPELFRGMGQGIREFKDASKEQKPEYRDTNPTSPRDPQQPSR